MEQNCPSRTAQRVAILRAAHQILDHPRIFDDPLALALLGLGNASAKDPNQTWLKETPLSRVLRATLAVRSRYAEDLLHGAVKQGIDQYVILGAGLDTFAYRNPYPRDVLNVFEVDHPTTQIWKRTRLEKADIPIPKALTFSPVNFETQSLRDGLRGAGFDTGKCAFFSWLGVTMYLTKDAISNTLRFVSSMPAGSGIVFDYMIPPSRLNPIDRKAFDGLAQRVALAGEPFQTFFDPFSLKLDLEAMGFCQVEDLDPEEMNARYFQGQTDTSRVGRSAHIINAQV